MSPHVSENTDINSPRGETNRIDLTQFDGCTRPDEKLFLEEMQEAFERAVVHEETVSDADANLALFAPYLLAELKRCYEEIDQLRETAQRLAQAHIGVYGL